MASTTNYSWSTPDDTALVKDGAAAIRSLGSAIDSTVFTNASAAISKTIVDAKGDIIAATAADTVARLAVGSDGYYLKADSTTATGLVWGAVGVNKNWTQIATTNFATTSASSYTFNSLSGYDNYLILQSGLNFTSANSDGMKITINSDTGSNYIYQGWSNANATINPDIHSRQTEAYFNCRQRLVASNTQNNAAIQISGANSSGLKWIQYDGVYREWSNDAPGSRAMIKGFWTGSGTITSIKIDYTQTANAGTLYLYGSV